MSEQRWTIRKKTGGRPYDTRGASIVGPDTEAVEVVPVGSVVPTPEQIEAGVRALENAEHVPFELNGYYESVARTVLRAALGVGSPAPTRTDEETNR